MAVVYWTSMDGPEVEHRVEIRRANRAGPIWAAIVVTAVVAVVALGRGGDEAAEVTPTTTSAVPSTPTSATLTTTTPAQPVVYGVTASAGGLAAFSTSHRPAPGSGGGAATGPGQLAGPVATDGRVAVLAEGALLAGRPGEPLEELGCCYDELHPSNEPGHVWVRDDEVAALVQLEGGGTVTELVVAGDHILGPGPYGLVTARADGTVRWRRPLFEPLEVPLGRGREPLDSGGGLVLASVADDVRVRRWELRSVPDGRLVESLDARGTWPRGTRALLSPDGRVLAVPVPTGWAVRVVPDLVEVGRLTRSRPPVWIGADRFAAVADPRVLVSDGTEVPVPDDVLALAEHSP